MKHASTSGSGSVGRVLRVLASFGALGVIAVGTAGLGAVVLSAAACDDDEVPMCIAPPGAIGTCEEACDRLYAIECLIGKDRDDCVSLCGLAVVPLADVDRDRVLACYAASSTCEQVDQCGRACGEGSPMIRFGTTDGGLADPDMGTPPDEDMGPPPDQDMGPPDEPDTGPPPDEEDMGAPEDPDAGGPPTDAG